MDIENLWRHCPFWLYDECNDYKHCGDYGKCEEAKQKKAYYDNLKRSIQKSSSEEVKEAFK